MPDEIITAKNLTEAKEELRTIYKRKSENFREITKEEYESFEYDEREDSDNHLNEERMEKGEAEVIDIAHYKYLPDRETAYHILLKDKNGNEMEDYFVIIPAAV